MTLLIEFAVVCILVILVVTQIILPLFGYGRYFWILKGKEKVLAKIDNEIEEIDLDYRIKEKLEEKEKMLHKNDAKN